MNVIWIQNDKQDEMEYMFYGNDLLNENNIKEIEIVRKKLFNNSKKKNIWKDKNYSQSSVSKYKSGYIFTGVLENTDDDKRKIPFMFYAKGKNSEIKEYFLKNILKINKSIDENLLELLLTKKSNYIKKVLFISILIILLIYKLLR